MSDHSIPSRARLPSWLTRSILLCAGIVAASTAIGQAPAPATAVQARQSQFREIGTAFKAINDELKKDAPGKFILASSARQIATNLRQVRTMFPTGSGPAAGIKTKARAEIWTDRAQFDRISAGAIGEADKLVLTLRGSDPAAVRAQVKALGATCQSCHRPFRAED